jgi:hypothetical protein
VGTALGVVVIAVAVLGLTALLPLGGESGIRVETKGPRLQVGDKPFFPIGLYYAPAAKYAAARDLGFNVVDVWAATNGSTLWALDQAGALGLKVIVVLQAAYQDGVLDAARMRTFVTAFRDHDALLAWYLLDEPPASISRPYLRTLESAYSLVKSLDPHHPTLIVYNQLAPLRMLQHVSDIVGVDPYPVPNMPLSYVSHQIEQAGLVVMGRKPVWAIMQAFEKEVPGAGTRYPTPAELHNMVYQALVGRAGAVYYFSYAWQGLLEVRSPALWQYLGVINRQVEALAPALLQGTDVGLERTVKSSPWLKTRAVSFSGQTVIVAVNVRDESAALQLAGSCGGPLGAEVLFEDRRLRSSGGSVLDSMPPYGVRAYAC